MLQVRKWHYEIPGYAWPDHTVSDAKYPTGQEVEVSEGADSGAVRCGAERGGAGWGAAAVCCTTATCENSVCR